MARRKSHSPYRILFSFVALVAILILLVFATSLFTRTNSRAQSIYTTLKSWHFDQPQESWNILGTENELAKGSMNFNLHEDTPYIVIKPLEHEFVSAAKIENKAFTLRLSASLRSEVLGTQDDKSVQDYHWINNIPDDIRDLLAQYLSHHSLPEVVRDLGARLAQTIPNEHAANCAQVVQTAIDPHTGTCREFPSPCDVPHDWTIVSSCAHTQSIIPDSNRLGPHSPSDENITCPAVSQAAYNPTNKLCHEFASVCAVPVGWIKIRNCDEVHMSNIVIPTHNTPSRSPTSTHESPFTESDPPMLTIHLLSGTTPVGQGISIPLDGAMHEYEVPITSQASDVSLVFTRTNQSTAQDNGDIHIAIDWIKLVGFPRPSLQTNSPAPTIGQMAATSPVPMAAAGNHNSTLWHTIQGQNHEHGDDPNSGAIVALFGSPGSYWNQGTGVNIGVPFNTSPLENTMKHPMSKYYTMLPSQIDAVWDKSDPINFTETTDNSLSGNNHVRAWRMLVHGGGNLMEALANNHSAFVEIQICDFDQPSQCGIFRSGGWIFWGKLQSPFYNQAFQRDGGAKSIGGMTMTFPNDVADLAAISSTETVFDNWGGEPYWFMFPNDPSSWSRIANGEFVGDQFSSNEVSPYNYDCAPFPQGCGNNLFHLAVRVFDGWNLLDRSNIYNPVFICSQISPSNCTYNGTFRGMKEVAVYVPVEWDQSSFDTDQRVGFVTLTRHTDRYQRLRPMGACSAISVDCVPLVLTNVPIGYASIKLKVQEPVPGIDREYDCPQGGCVSFPN